MSKLFWQKLEFIKYGKFNKLEFIKFAIFNKLEFLPKEFTHWLFSPELTSVHRYIGKINLQISKRRQLVRVLCASCNRLQPVVPGWPKSRAAQNPAWKKATCTENRK